MHHRTLLSIGRKILDGLHIKILLYNSLIAIAQERALYKVEKIKSNSSSPRLNPEGKKIIVNSVHGTYLEAIYKESGMAKALQLRGNNVKMLLCGQTLQACTGLFNETVPPNKGMCRNCVYFSKKFYTIAELPFAYYSEYISTETLQKINDIVTNLTEEESLTYIYKGVRVGFHTHNSLLRFYKGNDPQESKYDYTSLLLKRLTNAMIATEVAAKVVEKEKPDILLTSHGCYSSWGSFAEYFMNKGIRTRVWYTGIKKNSLIFDVSSLSDHFKMYYDQRKRKSLSKKEEKELQTFLKKRKTGERGGGDTYFFGFEQPSSNLQQQFHFKKYNTTYMMFPNIPWDASLVNANRAFQGVYEWISETIQLFMKKSDLQLIIKIHPAETKYHDSKKTVLDFIQTTCPHLPPNISIIPPHTNLSAYSLFPYIDVGLVYNGTIGLELLLHDIPVILAGKIHYSDRGLTYDVTNKKDYATFLFDKKLSSLSKQKKQLLHIYAYFHFIKNYIPYPILYFNSFLDHGWNITSFDDLAKGKNTYIDKICEYILEKNIYQDW